MEASIYTPVTLASFIQHVVQCCSAASTAPPLPADAREQPVIIVACCSRKVFQAHLLCSILDASRSANPESVPGSGLEQPKETAVSPTEKEASAEAPAKNQHEAKLDPSEHPLLKQTLRTLFASAAIKVAFCDSAPVLYAYLTVIANASPSLRNAANVETTPDAAHEQASTDTTQQTMRTQLIILNPLAMHRDSSSYSAQGLSQTFAAIYESAWRMGRALVVVETSDAAPASEIQDDVRGNVEDSEALSRSNVAESESTQEAQDLQAREPHAQASKAQDPWDAEVPIVNSSQKRFGTAADRAQIARKTTIRVVAARWFQFQRLPC